MSHFKYEIDERTLRLQLKSNEVPFSEEAWHKFESFSSARRTTANEQVGKRFNLSLNRNVMLPLVFGTVIVLFSFLLFNFINIKNPNVAFEARAELKKQNLTAPILTQVKKQSGPVLNDQISATKVSSEDQKRPSESAVNSTDLRVEIKPASPAATTPIKTEVGKEPILSPTVRVENSFTNANVNTVSRSPETPARKQLKKRTPIVSEATADEDEQAPPPVSEIPPPGEELK